MRGESYSAIGRNSDYDDMQPASNNVFVERITMKIYDFVGLFCIS